MSQDNVVELRCTDNGIRTSVEDGMVKVRRSAPMGFEARLYHNNDGQPPYFRGTGESPAEAVGALVFKCPEKFNAKIQIEGA